MQFKRRQKRNEKETRYRWRKQKITKYSTISIIILNVTGLSSLTKSQILSHWINPKIKLCLKDTLEVQRHKYIKSKRLESIYHENCHHKRIGIAIPEKI